jgi:hypothetical protein
MEMSKEMPALSERIAKVEGILEQVSDRLNHGHPHSSYYHRVGFGDLGCVIQVDKDMHDLQVGI